MTDTRAAFEAYWADEQVRNGGVPIGADYRHWAQRGWQAAINHERSECAKVCEDQGDAAERGHFCMGNGKWARACAAAIRARSQP